MAAPAQKVEIYGLLNDVTYQRARYCLEDLISKYSDDIFVEPVINGMLEFEWDMFIDAKKKMLHKYYMDDASKTEDFSTYTALYLPDLEELRGETWTFEEKAICFVNGELLGGPEKFIDWAEENFGFEEFRPLPLYTTLTEEAYKSYLNSKNHEYVYMDIAVGEKSIGRLVIELFTDKVPRTCENFKALCTGEKGTSPDSDYKLHFKNSLFHRIVRNGWIQGGDIYHSRGNGGESIYGPVFEDENFAVSHSKRGILGMASRGRHTNGSQFYITLQPTKWMDTKYVAFGQIIEGTETLREMEAQETMNERPNMDIKVTDCGVCTYEF